MSEMKKKIIITASIFFVVLLIGSMFSQAEAFFNKKLKNRIADLEIEIEILKEEKQIQGEQKSQEIKKSQNQLSDANKKIGTRERERRGADGNRNYWRNPPLLERNIW